MEKLLWPITSALKNHKLKILTVLLLAIPFAVFFLPGDDIADWVTQTLSAQTGNAVYAQVDHLAFDFLPSPGIDAQNVLVDARGLPTIRAGELHIQPLLSKLLALKPGVELIAEKVFRGTLDLIYSQGDKTASGLNYDDVSLEAEKINLGDLIGFLQKANMLNFKLEGGANLKFSMHLDRSMSAQPSLNATLDFPSLIIPGQSLSIPLNGVPVRQDIPTIDLGHVSIKNAKLNEGVLELQDLTIGDPKADLHGKIKGVMTLVFKKTPPGGPPEIKGLDFSVDLNMSPAFWDKHQKDFGMILVFIPPNLKTTTATGTHAAFRMRMATLNDTMPTFSALSEK